MLEKQSQNSIYIKSNKNSVSDFLNSKFNKWQIFSTDWTFFLLCLISWVLCVFFSCSKLYFLFFWFVPSHFFSFCVWRLWIQLNLIADKSYKYFNTLYVCLWSQCVKPFRLQWKLNEIFSTTFRMEDLEYFSSVWTKSIKQQEFRKMSGSDTQEWAK